jgi:CMP-N-acetylneuraminic acid synthetase
MGPIAIIPARGGSKRLPRKNILPLAGKPIIAHVIANALGAHIFDKVIVSSEDDEICVIAEEHGATVVRRPEEIATDASSVKDVVRHVLEHEQNGAPCPEVFCCIYPTAAFVPSGALTDSYRMLLSKADCDILMGVSRFTMQPLQALKEENGWLVPMFPEWVERKSQAAPRLVASNGTFYWGRSEFFLRAASFYKARLLGYELPWDVGIDIDTLEDYERAVKIAELIFAPSAG